MKKIVFGALALGIMLGFTGCNDAQVASENLSDAADRFEIDRRTVFYNGITGEYILTIRGKCSIKDQGHQLEIICMVGKNKFKKHFLGLSDNVTYFSEQMDGSNVSRYHYNVEFKPQAIVPDINFRGSTEALGDALTPDNKD